MTPQSKALAGLLADLAAAFGSPGDQTALVITETAGRMTVVVLMGSGPEHDAAVTAYQADSKPAAPELRRAS